MTLQRTDGPSEVRAAVEGGGAAADPWAAIYERDGDVVVGRMRLMGFYEEHLESYTGTDREPEPPPPHRSHHYTAAC